MERIAFSNPESALQEFEGVFEPMRHHFDCWEIVSEREHRVIDIEKRLKKLLDAYKIKLQIHAPFVDINIASPEERSRKRAIGEIANTIKVGSRLEVKVVTVHPGHFSPPTPPERSLELCKESLEDIGRTGEELGIKIALENMGRGGYSMIHTPGELAEMIEDTSLGFCFDVGHANFTGGWKQWVNNKELMSRLTNLHLHDNNGEIDEHMTIGEGNLDFEALLSHLRFYCGTGVIEARSLESAVLSKKRLKELMNAISQ
ncbi:MAG TPA: sugar phosphate isomerase/epimerase [Thermoplasmata archaeon]|nr:sugar phosphate isomerase/epimerase [Thermoplasmata archaeon]